MKLIAAMLMLATPAAAQGIDLLPYYETPAAAAPVHHVSAPRKTVKAKPKAKRKVSRPAPAPTRVMAFEERPEGGKCYAPITVVGSQWVGESGAYESAVKAMKERVRWEIGESAMDPANWTGLKKRCSLSSVGEVVGQVFHRCELTATPCRPPITTGTAP